MAESSDFPTVAWVDFNGPYWGDDELLTIQEHCSRRVGVGDRVLGICEGSVSWFVADHLEDDFEGHPDVIVCLRAGAKTVTNFTG